MSPRRRFGPGEGPLLVEQRVPREDSSPRLSVVGAVAAVLIALAITASTLMLIAHEKRERAATRDHQVLDYVTWFMGQFTTIDPYHANDYVTRVQAQATGDFAKQYQDNANEILLQIARAEPATGTVIGSGVERWNDDGTASVMVATSVTSKSADEKQVFENTNRWLAIVTREGKQWKISSLLQVI
jgi:Mce-associated membrane protein